MLINIALDRMRHFRTPNIAKKKRGEGGHLQEAVCNRSHAGKTHRHMGRNRSPCITKSRGASCGSFVNGIKRRMCIVEMIRLHGLTSQMAREFLDATGGDKKIV